MRDSRSWWPDALTLSRVPLIAVAYAFTFAHLRAAFVVTALVIVLTDILDGPIARTLRASAAQAERSGEAARDPREARGANLDSVADFFFFSSLVAWGLLWRGPELLPLVPIIALFFALYVTANLLSFSLRGVIGHHNRLSRLIATSGTVFGLSTILWGLSLALLAALILILAADLGQRAIAIAKALATKRAKRDEVERATER